MNLLLDEDSQSKILVNLLISAGHNVVTIHSASMNGSIDSQVLAYACQQRRALLTRNCRDFKALHQANPSHFGILGIYENRSFEKNLSRQSVVQALNNIETAAIDIKGQFVELNRWVY
ncbi:MAG: DUF5615 family PIN-like protein [Phormidesmis sp.]